MALAPVCGLQVSHHNGAFSELLTYNQQTLLNELRFGPADQIHSIQCTCDDG